MSDDQSIDERLGEQVDIHEISTDQLKHTGLGTTGGQSLPYPASTIPTDAKGTPFVDPSAYMETGYVAPAGAPSAPAPQAAAAPPAPASAAEINPDASFRSLLASANESNTIKRMREKFGTKAIELQTIEVGGFKWSFRSVGHSDISWALVLMAEFIDSEAQAGVLFNDAMVAVSVAFIDDIPVHEHFGIDVGTMQIPDPANPPRSLRRRAAALLFSLLADELNASVVQELGTFYIDVIDPLVKERMRGPLDPSSQPSGSSNTTESTG